jgi:protein tyrosine/serine phosphatase
VHCEAGKGRTGTAVACYRIAVDGWTAERAIAEGRTFGLTLVNQINFIEKFAQTIHGPAAAAPSTGAAVTASTTDSVPESS